MVKKILTLNHMIQKRIDYNEKYMIDLLDLEIKSIMILIFKINVTCFSPIEKLYLHLVLSTMVNQTEFAPFGNQGSGLTV